jgi:hypothetical protein
MNVLVLDIETNLDTRYDLVLCYSVGMVTKVVLFTLSQTTYKLSLIRLT